MRPFLAAVFLALPFAAMAQAPTPGYPAPLRGVITRDQFIQRATQVAAQRFDAIDANHTGVVTRAQLRAWRQAHQGQGAGQPPASP